MREWKFMSAAPAAAFVARDTVTGTRIVARGDDIIPGTENQDWHGASIPGSGQTVRAVRRGSAFPVQRNTRWRGLPR